MDISTRLHVLHVNFGYIFLECDQIIVPVYSLNIAELGRPVTGMITQVNLARKEDCSQISQYRNTSCLKMRRKILLSLRSEIRRLKNCSKRLNNDWYQHAKCSGIPFLNRHCLQRFQFRGLCEQIGVIIRKMCWRVFRKHQTARTCTTGLSLRYTFFIFSSQVLFCHHVLWRNCSCTN